MAAMQKLTRLDAEEFLYAEAALLDQRRLDEWLALFTADGCYWIPSREDADPQCETQIVFESQRRLQERVWRIQQHKAYAQSPPSQTVHVITNVRVDETAEGDPCVLSSLVVHEVRLDQERSLAGHCRHDLKWQDGTWRIKMKKISLLSRELPLHNITFLF